MNHSTSAPALKALLVGVQLPKVTEEETKASLAELARLVHTLGYRVIGETWQKRSSDRKATVLGDGKLREVARWTGGPGIVGPMVVKKAHKAKMKFSAEEETDEDLELDDEVDEPPSEDFTADVTTEENDETAPPSEQAEVVIFDCDLSPSQLRNLESATGAQVLDRTGVIIEIFSRHARTRAARLQVEIARLTYVAPRLRETGGGEDRQGGGIGGKGAGETSLELDRRKIRDRIKELKDELAAVSQEQDVRRARRERERTVALVGYTNAGKSSLMRALTGSEVLVADQLFATLDTTVRQLHPPSTPKILISDTVGFIKKLPHDLVASFKSTLDEAAHASLLLYVVDSSDASFRSQLEVTQQVLSEVGAQDLPSRLVLNKVDRLTSEDRAQLAQEYPEALFLSARNPQDVAELRLKLIEFFESDMRDEDVLIPYPKMNLIGEVRSRFRVIHEQYNEEGLLLKLRGHDADLDRLKERL